MEVKGTYRIDIILNRIFSLPRLLGAFPFDSEFRASRRLIAWSLFILSAAMIISSSTHVLRSVFFERLRRTLKVVAANSANILSLLVLIRNKEAVTCLRDSLRSVERELAAEDIRCHWDRGFFFLYRAQVIFIIILFFTLAIRISHYTFISILSIFLSYTGTFPILFAIVGQFVALQDVLYSFFDCLQSASKGRTIAISIEALRQATDASQKIYGVQLLLYIVCLFSFVVCNIYLEFVKHYSIETSIIHSLWLSFFVLAILDVVLSCNRTMEKAQRVNEVLYERMVDDSTDTLINNELLEFHVSCGRELRFTACGFFGLDNSLIYSMIACATTYLVILLQYATKLVQSNTSIA